MLSKKIDDQFDDFKAELIKISVDSNPTDSNYCVFCKFKLSRYRGFYFANTNNWPGNPKVRMPMCPDHIVIMKTFPAKWMLDIVDKIVRNNKRKYEKSL